MTPIAQSPLNRDWADDTEAEAATILEVPTAINNSKEQASPTFHEESLQPHVTQPVQATDPRTPPDLSPTVNMSERKARRNTTQALSCPEPAVPFQDSHRATSQPIPPATAKLKLASSTQNGQAETETVKEPQQVPTGPRSPARSPTRARGSGRGRGFRGRFRGRGRRNPSKVISATQQGRLAPTSTTPSLAPQASSSK